MTTFERFERSIPALMNELAPTRVPDYFDDMLRRTASHRQRPAWSYLERWLPVEITTRLVTVRSLPWRPILVTALVAILIAASLVTYVGSQRNTPPPFGVTANGALLFRGGDGSIKSFDPRTEALSTLLGSSAAIGEPVPSRDGRHLALVPQRTVPATIVVSGIDGSNRVALAGAYQDIAAVDWSPDGSHLAILSRQGGSRGVTIAASNGSGATSLVADRSVRDLDYLPDGRLALIASDKPGQSCGLAGENAEDSCALFVVNADGTGLDQLEPTTAFAGLTIDPSPDGSKLLYVEWSPGREGRLHIIDLRSRADDLIPVDGMPGRYSINRALFSPDGASVLFDFFEEATNHWAVVASSGGPVVRIGPDWTNMATDAMWAPDGQSVLAYYEQSDGTRVLRILDVTGKGGDRVLPVDVPYLPEWQRVSTSTAP